MRKILLLALGGTIACVRTKRGLMPKLEAGDLLKTPSLKTDFFKSVEYKEKITNKYD